MSNNKPPYTLTDKIVKLCIDISEIIVNISTAYQLNVNPKLRRENRVKTIQASLAIENNTLSLEQVTDIINGKRVLGSPGEIKEVKNAFEAYDNILKMDPYSINDMLQTHKILMQDLTKENGIFRNRGVGIFAGDRLVHMAPPAELVHGQISDLIQWVKESRDVHFLIKSCVFHYEFEFIHPFVDGNGRMGRMWQTLLLYQWNQVFGWLPIETLIKERQEAYYAVLGECDQRADSGLFVEFMLEAIYDSINELLKTEQVSEQVTDQVQRLLNVLQNDVLSTKEMMEKLELKHRPTFRDNYLLPALQLRLVEMIIPDKPNSSKQKYKKRNI